MITFWKQPGGKTMKLVTSKGSRHITTNHVRFALGLFRQQGFIVKDHGHKITVEKSD